MGVMPCALCLEGLSQRNSLFRNNDGGLQSEAEGGATSLGAINEDIFFEASGEGYTGGILRAHFTIRQTGAATVAFKIFRSKNGTSYAFVHLASNAVRIVSDPDFDFYAHQDDCPYIIAPLGGAENVYVENNNLALRSGGTTGQCAFQGDDDGGGSDEEAEFEASIYFVAEHSGEGSTFDLRLRVSDGPVFDNYVQTPRVTLRKQLIGADWTQAAYRVRLDDGPENLDQGGGGATWAGEINSGVSVSVEDVDGFRNRYLIQGDLPWLDEVQFVERYSVDGGATWLDVPAAGTGAGLGAPVERSPSAYLIQGDDTTEFAGRLGVGVWKNAGAGQVVDALQDFHDWETGAIETELEFSNVWVPGEIAVDQEIRFRVERVVPPTAVFFNALTSAALETYSQPDLIVTGSEPILVVGPLDEGIADLLQAKGLGTLGDPATVTGTVIVVGEEQETLGSMIAILPDGGRSDRILGEYPRFQLFSSSPNYEAARALAESVHQALDQHQGALLNRPVGRIQADSEPIPLGRGTDGVQGGRHRFAQTFTVTTRKL